MAELNVFGDVVSLSLAQANIDAEVALAIALHLQLAIESEEAVTILCTSRLLINNMVESHGKYRATCYYIITCY